MKQDLLERDANARLMVAAPEAIEAIRSRIQFGDSSKPLMPCKCVAGWTPSLPRPRGLHDRRGRRHPARDLLPLPCGAVPAQGRNREGLADAKTNTRRGLESPERQPPQSRGGCSFKPRLHRHGCRRGAAGPDCPRSPTGRRHPQPGRGDGRISGTPTISPGKTGAGF